MKIAKIEAMISEILNDIGNVTYDLPDVQQWIVESELATIGARNDAAAVTESVILIAGTRQSLPDRGLRLMSVIRNMGAGSTPGMSIRLVDRATKDDFDA